MAKRLFGLFYGINGANISVDIYDSAFVGTATAFDVKSCKIEYDSSNNDDITSPLIASRAIVGIVVPTTDATLTGFVEEFATASEDRFFLEIKNITTSLSVWRGVLTPDFSGEEDTSPSFVFTISAVCGIALLKKVPYHDGTEIYTGIERLTEHITKALGKLPHVATFWGASDIFLKTSVDWWAVDMGAGNGDDPFFQGGVDHAAFYDFKTEGDVDKDVLSCYDVIWHILKSFECRIFQADGLWWTEQISYRTSSAYYTRHYDKTGAYLSNASNAGTNVIDQTDNGAKIATVNYDFLPAIGSARVYYDSKIKRNFLASTSTNDGDFDTEISSNSGTAIMRLRFTIRYAVQDSSFTGPPQTQFFLIPSVTLKIGDNYLTRDYTISNFTALPGALEWASSGGIAVPIALGTVPPAPSQRLGMVTVELVTPPLPTDGSDNFFGALTTSAEMVRWNGSAVDETEFNISVKIIDSYLEIYDDGTPIVNEEQILYESIGPDASFSKYETTVRLGTADLPNSAGRVMRWNGSGWVPATLWGQGVDARTSAIGDLLAKNTLNARDTHRRRLNGTLYGNFSVKKLLSTTEGKRWMMSNASWDIHQDTLQGTWFELAYGGAGVNSTPVKIKVNPSTKSTFPPTFEPAGVGTSNDLPGFNTNPAPTVLAPVSYNAISAEITKGDTITSIPIVLASEGNEFLAGDGVTLVNPITGNSQTFEINIPPTAGATTLSVVSAVANFDAPQDSYLIVKQKAFAFSYTAEQAQDDVLGIFTDSATIDFTYDDATPAMSAIVKDNSVGTVKIIDNNITLAKLIQIATASVLGRTTAGTGNVEVLTAAQTTAILDIFTSTLKGLVPASGGGTTNFLRADGTWDAPVATVSDGDKGDITVSGSGATWTIDDNAVSFSKIQDITTDRLLGRDTAGSGDVEQIALNVTLEFDGALNLRRAALTGDVTAAAGSNSTTIANDAITNTKLSNMPANTIKGNNTGGVGDPIDLTVAQIQTLLSYVDGSGTAGRIAFWIDTNTIDDSGNLLWDNANNRVTITGTVVATGANNAWLNLNGGSLTGDVDVLRASANISSQMIAVFANARNTGNTGDVRHELQVGGTSAGDPYIAFVIPGGTNFVMGIDNTDSDYFKITPGGNKPGSTANKGLVLSSHATSTNIGINKDAPAHPLDVAGVIRGVQYRQSANLWVAGNIAFDTGAGTGPVINSISGGNNGFQITFTSGTAPAADGIIFTATYPNAYGTLTYVVKDGRGEPAGVNFLNEQEKFNIHSATATTFVLKASGTITASTIYGISFIIQGY